MRRRTIAVILPGLCAAVMPARALAAKAKDEKKPKGKPEPARPASFPAQAPARPVSPAPAAPAAAAGPAAPLVTPAGTERMVSDPVQLVGAGGDGEGPVRLEVEGARANSVYEVNYVPASNPTLGVLLGTINTDAAGRFSGATTEAMPGIAEAGRTGVILLRRV